MIGKTKTIKVKILLLPILFFTVLISAQVNKTLSNEVMDEITDFIESKRMYYNCPSVAVAITDEKETIYLKHFGEAKKGDKYFIGSNSKSFTALLILMLQEEGKINIDDAVNKYLKWFKYKNENVSRKITIRDLLQHTSGITTEMGRTFIVNNESFNYVTYYSDSFKNFEAEEVLPQPYQYSNANYRLLGMVIEKVVGERYDEVFKKYISKRMNLNETSAAVPSDVIDSYQYLLYYPILKFNETYHLQEASSGLIASSASDMAIYLREIMNAYNTEEGAILKSDMVQQLFVTAIENKAQYGLGWFVVKDPLVFYHSGTNRSFESSMYMLPSLKKSVVVLINSNQAPDVEIINGIYGILLGKGYYNKSSFAYYRSLPLVALLFMALFLVQLKIWKSINFSKNLSKKIIPNMLLFLGVSLALSVLLIFPKLNGVSLKTAFQFDPASGYSIVLIAVLMFFTFLLFYFNTVRKSEMIK